MPNPDAPLPPDILTVEEMKGWLENELRDSAKARELRAQEATNFVQEYAADKITPGQAMQKLLKYDRRWGEALYGATAAPGVSDAQILQAIDDARSNADVSHVTRIHSDTSPVRKR